MIGADLGPQIEYHFSASQRRGEFLRKLGNVILPDETQDADLPGTDIFMGRKRHLEVGDLGAGFAQAPLKTRCEPFEKLVAIERFGRAGPDRAVEPPQQLLAFRIDVVIDIEDLAAGHLGALNALEPRLQSGAFACRDLEDFRTRVFELQRIAQALPLSLAQEIAFVDDDQVGFFELLAIDVNDFGREPAPGLQAEDPCGAHRVDDDAQGRDGEGIAVDAAQRVTDRGHEIRAAPHRFGDEHVGTRLLAQLARGRKQGIEPAAEAPSGDFLDGETLRAQIGGIDEVRALVVGDQAHAQTLIGQGAPQPSNGGRFPGPQEASDHDVARFVHVSPIWAFLHGCSSILSIVSPRCSMYPCTSTAALSGVPFTP